MRKDKFKAQFALDTATAFQQVYPDVFAAEGEVQVFSPDFVSENLEQPKDPSMGRFAFPVFRYGRLLGDKPPQIASKVAEVASALVTESATALVTFEAVGGFLNGRVEPLAHTEETLRTVLELGDRFGASDVGSGKRMLVEYCSANIAKPFGIGHLRSTVIGHSLRRIFGMLGYDVVGINYLGDWGTQFGKMIAAYRKWGSAVTINDVDGRDAVKALLELYVRFHREAAEDPSLDDEARLAFKTLEDGDPGATELWERFKTISMAEFKRIFDILGVQFDFITGEAFLNDKMDAVIDRLSAAGLTETSEGALIVDLKDPQLPPCLLKKADGATLYATRDLAGLIYRWDNYSFHESLYVVATGQSDHFKQAFKVIEMLEEAENQPPEERMTGRVKHIGFGWVKFAGRTMSTRKGDTVFLEDVIDEATALAKEKILEKNPDLAGIDDTARLIGVGAVIFSQLSVRKHKDINFVWDDVLSFEGETGPYLQYTHARLCSLQRKYGKEIAGDVDASLLGGDEEQRIVELLADFPGAVDEAARAYDPHVIASYLLRLAGALNKLYQRKTDDGRIDKIISDDERLSAARMALVKAVQIVVKQGLYLLGLQAPEEM